MILIELNGATEDGAIRLNLEQIEGYNDKQLWLHGGLILDLMPGTSKALDQTIRDLGIKVVKVEYKA